MVKIIMKTQVNVILAMECSKSITYDNYYKNILRP